MIPIQLLELGEEIGWRGYLLGFNYSIDNPGAPWSNMAMIPLIVLAVICFIRLGKKAKQ